MGRKKTLFDESLILNRHSYQFYLDKLTELALSMIEWKNLPETADARYLELVLFTDGNALFFEDEYVGLVALSSINQGRFNIYGEPVLRRAYSRYNNYQKTLTYKDSVIVWNNFLRKNTYADVEMFAKKLWQVDRIIDVNLHAQKTPVLIKASEKQRLTMINLYKQYAGNEPFIFGDNNLDINDLTVLKTDAPYLVDKLVQHKHEIWNDALTHLGISNINITKKERLITDEVTRNQGGTIASRYSRLESRREAVEKINKMFGTNIEVNYREDFQQAEKDATDTLNERETYGDIDNKEGDKNGLHN